jgi:hypothetical protein
MAAKVDVLSAELHCQTMLNNALIAVNESATYDGTTVRFFTDDEKVKLPPASGDVANRARWIRPFVMTKGTCKTIVQLPSLSWRLLARSDTYYSDCEGNSRPQPAFDVDVDQQSEFRANRDRVLFLVTNSNQSNSSVRTTAVLCQPNYVFGPADVTSKYLNNGSVP